MHQAIAKGEIHLWLAYLEPPEATLRSLWGVLSDDERHQADRFHFQGDRLHYIASRGTLRCILSKYTSLTPEHLEFQYGSKGKPALSPDCNPDDLRFNLSHSHKLAFYACLLQHEIGVDIEYIKPVQDMENLARRYFSMQEYETLRLLPEQHKLEAFFNCWTRKEAYIKACGNSISQPLDKFEVSLAVGEPARLLSIDGSNVEASRWYLHGFAPAAGYIAALAVQGEKWKLLQPQWSAPGQAELSPLASR